MRGQSKSNYYERRKKQGLLTLTGTGLLRLGEHFVAGPYAMQKSYTTAAGSTVGLVWWTCGLSGGWGKGCLQFPGCLFFIYADLLISFLNELSRGLNSSLQNTIKKKEIVLIIYPPPKKLKLLGFSAEGWNVVQPLHPLPFFLFAAL